MVESDGKLTNVDFYQTEKIRLSRRTTRRNGGRRKNRKKKKDPVGSSLFGHFPSLEQNPRFDFAIFKGGVLFLVFPVLGQVSEHAFGRLARTRCLVRGHEVVRLAKLAVCFRLGDGVNVIHNVMGYDGIQWARFVAEE